MNKPTPPVPDPDVLPDDMDLDDRVATEPAPKPPERPRPADADIASAQRPPADS